MATVLMKCNEGPWSISFGLPNGKIKTIGFKPLEEGGPCVAEVPVEVDYIDDFNKKHRFLDNYAQSLLNAKNSKGDKAYPFLEVISVKESPVIEEEKPKKGKRQ